MSRALLIVVSGPAGSGKTTLCARLNEAYPQAIRRVITCTTRAPRPGEVDGVDYHFLSRANFEQQVAAGVFLEHAIVHGNLYGTSRASLEAQVAAGHDVVLEIDWQGALQLKALLPEAVLIFILPPSWEELAQRLNRRGEDAPDVIAQRLVNARIEVAKARHFDFVIINGLFETALFDLKTVVHSQRLRYAAQIRNKTQVFAALNLI